jgi:hypothetical protein
MPLWATFLQDLNKQVRNSDFVVGKDLRVSLPHCLIFERKHCVDRISWVFALRALCTRSKASDEPRCRAISSQNSLAENAQGHYILFDIPPRSSRVDPAWNEEVIPPVSKDLINVFIVTDAGVDELSPALTVVVTVYKHNP